MWLQSFTSTIALQAAYGVVECDPGTSCGGPHL